MSIVAAIIFTALLMGYPLHRAVVERDAARKAERLARKEADAAHDLLAVIFRDALPSNVVPLRREGER